eukprot:snap_masked-scaffold_1-processed-gene-14.27-mRNA-1 protein AED:0.11 eAED:0.13 QI:0/-1/0/1/-1/1/1/0/309
MSFVRVLFPNGISSSFSGAFDDAVDYWNDAINGNSRTGDINVGGLDVEPYCGVDYTYPSGYILTTLDIFASVVSIDGSGGILGQAGPCATSNLVPRLGIMQFDSADSSSLLSSGSFDLVIKHEMAHVIGIGTMWSSFGIISGAGGSNPQYTGSNGNAGYGQLGGSGNIPIENSGGSGTRDGHWRETTFENELMTGYLNSGSNPNSIMSVRSLQDMGYSVDTSAAESYSIPKEGSVATTIDLDFGHDLLDFEVVDLEVVAAENQAKIQFQNELMFGAIILAVASAFIVLAAVAKKKMGRKETAEGERSVV